MSEPLFLKPVLQDKMWGGKKLGTIFHYDLPSDKVGECWAISAHPHGPSTVENGAYQGMTLDQVWAKHRDVFGNAKGDVFPLLTKILDAEDDLSVQVHPDDYYGQKHEGELGKTECWYVIAADPGAEIIYGHHAKTREALAKMIHEGEWNQLLTHVPVKAGDFFYVPSGTIHGIGKGIMILETQQSSDTTYRVYDYDRVDAKTGEKRELHIQQSIDVTNVPNITPENQQKVLRDDEQGKITQFVASDFFSVFKWEVKKALAFKKEAPYTLVSVLDGEGELIVDQKKYAIQKGVHFILPADVNQWELVGKLEIIASTPGIKA